MSMRELWWMAEASQSERWDRMSSLLALLVNINRGKGQKAVNALDFHPIRQAKVKPVPMAVVLSMLTRRK